MFQSITPNLIVNLHKPADGGFTANGSNAPETTVCGLLCVNVMYKHKICLRCGVNFVPTSGNQLYCGSRRLRTGCIWRNLREAYLKRDKTKEKEYWSKKWVEIKKNRKPKTCLDCNSFIEENDFRKNLCKKCRIKHTKNKGIKKRFMILSEFNFTCVYCGRHSPEVELHIDHLIPKSKNGSNKKENLVVACKECNQGKSDLILPQSSWRFCL